MLEGINKEKYKYVEYNSNYPKLFEEEKRKIIKVLPKSTKVEHVGSTSVPGLGGKGIIDIAIKASKIKPRQFINQLEKLGYKYNSEHPMDGRRIFLQKVIKSGRKERRIHIHLALSNDFWDSFIAFRDYLRKNENICEEYSKIKREAVVHAEGRGDKYREYKDKFLKEAAGKAFEEYQKRKRR